MQICFLFLFEYLIYFLVPIVCLISQNFYNFEKLAPIFCLYFVNERETLNKNDFNLNDFDMNVKKSQIF